jgi:hypothetical protein
MFKHVEEQTACRIAGVDVLIERVQVNPFACKYIGNMAQMEGGAGQSVQAGHHEHIAFPDIFQTVVQARTYARRATCFLLDDFVAGP